MCLYISRKKPLVAKKDIVVYKYVRKQRGHYVTACQNYPIQTNKVLTASHNGEDIVDNNYGKLEQFDLAALLRIADKSWYDMRSFAYLPTSDRECVRAMMRVRNNWAHIAGAIYDKDIIINDLTVILNFFELIKYFWRP